MEGRIIQRILRVNHAGEHGAVSIYSQQLERAEASYPDLVPWLQEVLSHERRHRAMFEAEMPNRSAKPCRLLSIWDWGGSLLGLMTGLFGRAGVYACTIAVERTVHEHLLQQIAVLDDADPAVSQVVSTILVEEDEHLAHAARHQKDGGLLMKTLAAVVSAATEALIFISTRGDSLNLKRQLAQRY